MNKIESLNKKIADAEALLQDARAELARLEESNKATAETVAEYVNSLLEFSDPIFEKGNETAIVVKGNFAHRHLVVAFGRMQEAASEYGYFQQGWEGIPGLSFSLDSAGTWDEVLAALKAKEDYIRAAMRGE